MSEKCQERTRATSSGVVQCAIRHGSRSTLLSRSFYSDGAAPIAEASLSR